LVRDDKVTFIVKKQRAKGKGQRVKGKGQRVKGKGAKVQRGFEGYKRRLLVSDLIWVLEFQLFLNISFISLIRKIGIIRG